MCTAKCIYCIVASGCGNVGNSTVGNRLAACDRHKQAVEVNLD